MKTYKDLEIYQTSLQLFYRTHKLSLKLPKYELYELGSQLRRSSNSINSNIVEGYGRSRYKQEFIKFLVYSLASNDETVCHLEKVKFLYPENDPSTAELIEEYNSLGSKINRFIQYVKNNWKT